MRELLLFFLSAACFFLSCDGTNDTQKQTGEKLFSQEIVFTDTRVKDLLASEEAVSLAKSGAEIFMNKAYLARYQGIDNDVLILQYYKGTKTSLLVSTLDSNNTIVKKFIVHLQPKKVNGDALKSRDTSTMLTSELFDIQYQGLGIIQDCSPVCQLLATPCYVALIAIFFTTPLPPLQILAFVLTTPLCFIDALFLSLVCPSCNLDEEL